MKKISLFQIIFLGVFVVFIVVGVASFAMYKGSSSGPSLPSITIWGTYPANTFTSYVSQINNTLAQSLSIKYVEKSPAEFSQAFVSALAQGSGPDAILITADMLLPQENKLAVIPSATLLPGDYMRTYIGESSIYQVSNGTIGLPFEVDPLVMYWNKDSFNAAGIAQPPHYWDEFANINPKLMIKDSQGNIRKASVALGDFANVNNAREILGTLIMQLGNPITALSADGVPATTLKVYGQQDPTQAIQFFSQFSNPSDPNYAWNRSLTNSKTLFLSGNLATYFGFASEIADIRDKNPNLNFDVAMLPQIRPPVVADPKSSFKITRATYGRMYAFSITRAATNPSGVYQVLSYLNDPTSMTALSTSRYLPSVLLSVINNGTTDPYLQIFNNAALNSKAWLDVDTETSNQIFGNMIQSITSGQQSITNALSNMSGQYDVALKQAIK